MSNDLLTILSAHGREQFRQAQRETWLKHCPIDYKFFLGGGTTAMPDEIIVPAPDNYFAQSAKLQAALRWACDHDYDRIFKTCDDTYIRTNRLSASEHDYCGCRYRGDLHALGGPGYWLSKKSMQMLLDAEPNISLEDVWAYEVLRRNGITCHHDPRYIDPRFCSPSTDWISRSELDPKLMRAQHQLLKVACDRATPAGLLST